MITVLGGSGFIGSNLIARLSNTGMPFNVLKRGESLINGSLGHIIYCIGMTADFRHKPFETIEAHVCLLNKILRESDFESLTYLSSTRVYINTKEQEVTENTAIPIYINDSDELYTLSKLTGERICLSSGRNAKVARLSNVYGADYLSENFITDILKKVQKDGFVKFFTTPDSSKDYISVEAVTDLLIKIANDGRTGIYNVASGENISNYEIIEMMKQRFSFKYEFDENPRQVIFPKINVDKIKDEFGFSSDSNKSNLFQLIKKYGNDTN